MSTSVAHRERVCRSAKDHQRPVDTETAHAALIAFPAGHGGDDHASAAERGECGRGILDLASM
jgi:hypothetical protein